MNRRELGRDLAMIGLIAAALVALFWRAVSLKGAFFVQDVMVQNYPFRDFFARALKAGTLPLWCPDINLGFPLFAEGQAGVLYPVNLLFALLLPTYAALNFNIVLHLWWAGAGTYFFLRLLRCGRAAALTGGLTYACSGYMVIRAMSPNYIAAAAWMPFLFVLVEWALQRQRQFFLPLAGGVVGLQFLAGHAQAAVYALVAVLLYGGYRGLLQRPAMSYWLLLLAGIPLIGGAAAAVQLLPTAELVQVSARGDGMTLAQFTSMSLPPERLVSLLLPNFFGNSSTGSYWGREAGFFIQLCAYVGILPLLLSLVAGWERKDCTTGFFCALAGVSLVLALGHYTALFEWLYYIPGLKAFRIPARFLLWFAFAVAVLAGLGADHVLEGRQQRSYKNWWYVCLGLALMAGGMIWLNRDILLAPEPALERWGQMLERYQEDLFQDLWRLGIALTAGGWVLTGGGKGKRSWKIAVLAPLLIYVDLFHFGYRFNDTIDPEIYRQTPSTALAILADRKEEINGIKPRILGLVAEKNSPYNWHSGWVHDLSSYRKYAQTLRLYTGSTYGLANALPGWSPLHLQRQWEFVSGYPRFADLAGIEYAVNYGTLKWPGWERVAGDELQVYRNSQTLPRVYSVGDYRVILDRGKRLSYLKSKRFEAGRQVVLEEEPDEKFNTEPGSAQIVSYSAEEIEIAWRGGGGLLVLNDTYYPGWRVFVDGWEGRIMRANHVFRAVSVPSGSREIVFQYRPQSFVWGMWISLTTLLGLAILVLYGRHRTIGDMRPLPDEIEGLKAWTAQAILIVAIHAWVIQGSAWLQMFERSRVLKVLGIG